jgi:predicted GNAT superfamily acetyltransferase
MSDLTMPRQSDGLSFRRCQDLPDIEQCVDLQQRVWGYADRDVTPCPVFIVAERTGGHVLGAFDHGQLVGFVLGLAAGKDGILYVHSHFVAVLPEYRNRGIGRLLKLRQREECLRQGIRLIEWTFDPLQMKNARLNITRLGAIVRRYLPDAYGITSSPVHGGLPTDRLVAEWHLDSPRVLEFLGGKAEQPGKEAVCVTLPANIGEYTKKDIAGARRIQTKLRHEFEHWFGRGYAVTGFTKESETASYILEPYAD